jgi:hypothetical protein
MDSKTFESIFLNYENDEDILDAQYVLVSTRIRTNGKHSNVVNYSKQLYPDTMTFASPDSDSLRYEYYKQLKGVIDILAELVKYTIDENANVIFMCSHNEHKTKYIEYLAEFILLNFDYPVYDYAEYITGKYKLYKYDKNKCLALANKHLRKRQKRHFKSCLHSLTGIQTLRDEFNDKDTKKKDFKRFLKTFNLDDDKYTKKEMRDIIMEFLASKEHDAAKLTRRCYNLDKYWDE